MSRPAPNPARIDAPPNAASIDPAKLDYGEQASLQTVQAFRQGPRGATGKDIQVLHGRPAYRLETVDQALLIACVNLPEPSNSSSRFNDNAGHPQCSLLDT